MADRKNFVGARLRVTTSEGEYEGTVHSIDAEKRKLTLTKGEKFVTFSKATMSTLHGLPEGKRNVPSMPLSWCFSKQLPAGYFGGQFCIG